MNALLILRSSTFANWWKAFLQLLISLLGNLAPLWISLITYICLSHREHVPELFYNGQLSIYTVAILTSWINVSVQYNKKKNDKDDSDNKLKQNKNSNLFLWILNIFVIIICSVIYSNITMVSTGLDITLNRHFILTVSIILIAYASIILYFYYFIDEVISSNNYVPDEEINDLTKLRKKLKVVKK